MKKLSPVHFGWWLLNEAKLKGPRLKSKARVGALFLFIQGEAMPLKPKVKGTPSRRISVVNLAQARLPRLMLLSV